MDGSIQRASGNLAYRLGSGAAVLAALVTVWTTIVRDDGHGAGFFMVILAAGVGAFSAWCRPAGMARTMLGVAVMQAALCGLAVTAPVTLAMPGAATRIVLHSGLLIALWLTSAAFFRAAANADRAPLAM